MQIPISYMKINLKKIKLIMDNLITKIKFLTKIMK